MRLNGGIMRLLNETSSFPTKMLRLSNRNSIFQMHSLIIRSKNVSFHPTDSINERERESVLQDVSQLNDFCNFRTSIQNSSSNCFSFTLCENFCCIFSINYSITWKKIEEKVFEPSELIANNDSSYRTE